MRKFIILTLVVLFLLSCSSKSDKVERIWEDDVEVIIIHLEPYKIEGEPSSLILEKEFIIDTEDEDIVSKGLTDIDYFRVNSEENIFFLVGRNEEGLIVAFDKNGDFIRRFGRTGQGPGEMQGPRALMIISQNNIVISDIGKALVFSQEGKFVKKIKTEYRPVPITEEDKKKIRDDLPYPPDIKKRLYFPEYMPPFQYFFADEEGRLYVLTYEKGENPGEYICDIFNSEGIFLARKNIVQTSFLIDSKNGRLYVVREKDSGYKELVVYKMRWE